jgi:hypothetical protein
MILYLFLLGILIWILYKKTYTEHFTERKKIVFLFSGNARTSPFTVDKEKRSQAILDSYNQYIFTESFKEKYDYEVYITSDNIHLQDTIQYFSKNHIKNIHLLDSEYYLTHNSDTKNIEYYLNQYNQKDWSQHQKYEGSIHQHYKILDCYELAKKDNSLQNCDYIVRIRLDVVLQKSIEEVIQLLETSPALKIVIDWDFFALGTPPIMEWYCTGLEHNYGNYQYNVPVPDTLPVMNDYGRDDKKRWTYSAERQLFEMLYDYCHQHKLDINQTIMHTNVCTIQR